MEKTATLNLRVNPEVKLQAENVLEQLGISMATAVDMFLRQISLTGGIPFAIALPDSPPGIDADTMSIEQLRAELIAGYDDMKDGNAEDASTAFARFRDSRT